MGRIRQQHPQNYNSSANISTEFENVIRYLVAAERGGKTLGEMLTGIFDDDGVFDGPIELRRNLNGDVQYRVGEYTEAEAGWKTIAVAADLRGATGSDVGIIGAPVMHSRVDVTPANSETIIVYNHDEQDELLVYVDGVLQREGAGHDYEAHANINSVEFAAPFTGAEVVTIYKIQASTIVGYKRVDTDTTATQAVFPFAHDATAQLNVYKNGLLQREGAGEDYLTSSALGTVTFNTAVPAGNTVSIITVENTSQKVATGLMTETNFVDLATGLIRLDRIGIDDDALPQAKVAGLTTSLAATAKLTVDPSTPVGPTTGDLWLDTSSTPNQLRFWDGSQWLRTTPNSLLPGFASSDASRVLRVNGTGTGLEFAPLDLSSVIAKTEKAAANGVATLDSSGKLPVAQLPEEIGTTTLHHIVATAANTDYTIRRVFREKLRLDGLAVRTTSGTCTVQLLINGVPTGPTYSAASTPSEQVIASPIDIDATSASVAIGYRVTGNASAATLDVAVAATILLT